MKRVLARNVVCDGVRYGLSLVTVGIDGSVRIAPFVHETHSTTYVEGILEITTCPGAEPLFFLNGRPYSISRNNL